MGTTFEIHPSIGIARVGSSVQHFVGPEPDAQPPNRYRDAAGALLRQAARFRVFECERDDDNVLLACREVTPDRGTIEWTVHLANTKAAGFNFVPPPDGGGILRNPGDPRDELKIDPGPRTVHAGNPAASFDTGRFRLRPVPLGGIRVEESGRLLVLGGFGKADSDPEGNELTGNFADNNDWFDDVSDGPVRATVSTADGRTQTAKPSWVIVAPPDFAPGITNFVTMYDVARDVAVQRGLLAVPEQPSFTRDVYPILSRPFAYTWVSARAALAHRAGRWRPTSPQWAMLADPTQPAVLRRELLNRLRNPRTWPLPPSTPNKMPRLHDQSNEEGEVLPPTVTQYAILEKWVAGSFIGDWQTEQDSGELIADALDRVALQACSGGAFFPGIEAGRIMTKPEVYSEPYRLDAESLVPGQITQGNALPWQADFLYCRDDSLNPRSISETSEQDPERLALAWWPAQRPDKVYLDAASAAAGTGQEEWAREIDRNLRPGGRQLVRHWAELGIVVETPGPDGQPVYVETERVFKALED